MSKRISNEVLFCFQEFQNERQHHQAFCRKELTIYYYDDDTDQQALIAAAEAQQTVRIRHQWPNGTRATYDLKLLGYQIMSGSADGFMQLKVSGRQASDVVWSNADVAEQEGE